MINTAAEAQFVVNAAKFPPLGIRGQGSPFCHWTSNLSLPEYVQSANKNLLTLCQIETQQAVDNVDEIVGVEGVGELPLHHFAALQKIFDWRLDDNATLADNRRFVHRTE